jgi:hypothetical protein
MARKPPQTEFEKMNFPDVVDVLAGQALLRLIRGEKWRDVIFYVASAIAQWKDGQR